MPGYDRPIPGADRQGWAPRGPPLPGGRDAPVHRAIFVLMATRTHVSVLELCSARAAEVEPNRWKAAKLAGMTAAFIDEWARMMRETGNESPRLSEWAAWACVPERTAYRRLADFRRLFAEWHDDPTVLARHVNRAVARRKPVTVPGVPVNA